MLLVTDVNLLKIGKLSLIVAAILTATAYVAFRTMDRKVEKAIELGPSQTHDKQKFGFGSGA